MEKKGTGAEHVSYRHNVFRNKMLGFEKILFIIMVSVNILYIIVSFADKNLPAIMTEDIIRLISVTVVQIISCCSFRIIAAAAVHARQAATSPTKGPGWPAKPSFQGIVIFCPKKLVITVGTDSTIVAAAIIFMITFILLLMIEAYASIVPLMMSR